MSSKDIWLTGLFNIDYVIIYIYFTFFEVQGFQDFANVLLVLVIYPV